MRMRLGNWPLAVKLWGAFASLTLLIFTLLAILLPWTLKGFFTEQLYDILLDTQSGLRVESTKATTLAIPAEPIIQLPVPSFVQGVPMDKRILVVPKMDLNEANSILPNSTMAIRATSPLQATFSGPTIQHFMISGTAASNQTFASSATISEPFMQAMEHDAFAQQLPVEKYTRSIENKSIFYVIRKEGDLTKPNFIVSYAWGNYRNDLVMTMFGRLMLLMVGLIVISWLPCLGIARYFTRPLVQMERHVGRMAERDWHEPISTSRKDEIGRLAKAIESMRQRLVRQDRAQQFFLQHTSHELKTPVMVIRSYAQSIQDGVYPKGTLNESVGVIMKEGERLEKRIRDLLLLNKLNYLTAREKPFQPFEINAVVEDVVERLRYRRPEIKWEMDLAPHTTLIGDQEQWKIALENMLDNQLRYAKNCIRIVVKSQSLDNENAVKGQTSLSKLCISNDGPLLDQAIADTLFEPFRSGGDGQFGLGLAIVKQIMDHHGMTVRAANQRDGVSFYIEPGKQTNKSTVPKVS
ncbi:HAMP domain-containing histidine kinase [Paenibacillus alginolyticus]|uniref:histidine kinase n=1 Tax=Paenibacillus alginolyticus TaxID=59839 RepID=A0ABT4G9T1_9BACL|nr:HAMP domain-containing sensor histidine kinase [Paenibacillus alginolyticus]MCY9667064.1 HAMP domain-containing histidine kinase [Paenibacillus alginolyticus]MCY9692889.1 HAMP domain-containing histidine kinase [Paenibacillus alginolyticus]MEC0144375.1 HAMP domain-containing sensor histidine kinase [Paenibacillus alginolyticus]